jgi:hypothetical protein
VIRFSIQLPIDSVYSQRVSLSTILLWFCSRDDSDRRNDLSRQETKEKIFSQGDHYSSHSRLIHFSISNQNSLSTVIPDRPLVSSQESQKFKNKGKETQTYTQPVELTFWWLFAIPPEEKEGESQVDR